jgi:hypothetical protein
METDNIAPFSDLGLFQYSPLNINEFRLLGITRLEQSLDKSLPACKLVHAPIDNALKYNALSYVWGLQNDQETIAINDKAFSVSVNLCTVLCALFHYTEPHIVWIDAICINQKDDEEKVTQIPLMREIYSRAACVVAWVGREEHDSDTLFASMDFISDLLSKVDRPTSTFTLDEGLLSPEYTLDGYLLSPENTVFWNAISRLSLRPWFRRLWVFQEIILAKELMILCGSKTATWASLFHLAKEVRRNHLGGLFTELPEQSKEDIDFMMEEDFEYFIYRVGLIREHQMEKTRDTGILMVALLRDIHKLHCTFNVDRIYGLLGLVRGDLRRSIVIDYSLEERFWEVWLSAGKLISMKEPDGLHILLQMADCYDPDKKCPELPSWFPDLRNEIEVERARAPFSLRDAPATGSLPDLQTFADSNKICVRGLSVDLVEDSFPSKWRWPTDLSYEPLDIPAGLAWHRKCLDLARVSKMQSQDYLEDYLYTLTAGAFDGIIDERLTVHWDKPVNQSKEAFIRMIKYLEGYQMTDETCDPSHSYELGFRKWADNITLQCRNRAFFTTEHGRIGLGLSSMTKGDKICIFRGMPWPTVLRWNNEKSAYSFIGLAYVHGIIEWEGSDMKGDEDSGVAESETFTIC